jgi:GT2 family glycosyltransferase/glycosyltransferase involved in cell wall biosynthesis
VIVPVHGKWTYTLDCLRSLASCGDERLFEVIVVDDCSPDETGEQLRRVEGVRVVTTPENLGFIGACNAGAATARADVLVFLNNDTEVTPGWLDALLEVLERDATVGLVGAMLVGEDGLVQESGGIIWADGSGWNYGRGEAVDSASVRALRDVDYCAGAAIAVRRSLFELLGGFDQRYAPAYYEDTDLCFGIRAAGYRVVVQPESVVVHKEGGSHGKHASGGLKRFQNVNRHVLVSKWRQELANNGAYLGAADLWHARNRRPGGMILVADATLPMPDRDSGSRRMAAILRELVSMGMSVHFAPAVHVTAQPYARELEQQGITVLVTESEQQRFLREAGERLDAVILCREGVAWQYLDLIYRWAPQATIIFDTVDLHAVRTHRQARSERDEVLTGLADLVWIRERGAMEAADVTLVVSNSERELLHSFHPELDVRVVSNIHVPVDTSPVLAGRRDLVFVGNYQHVPNTDAARWAATEIMPVVRRSVPDATLQLVGAHMPPEIERLAGPGVEAPGWMPDIAPCYRQARAVIAPLRFGAGVKGKIAEAIEFGVPVIATTVAIEGMDLVDGADVLVADDAEAFAAACVELLVDDELWRRLAAHGQASLAKQFSPARAREVFESIIRGDRPTGRRRMDPAMYMAGQTQRERLPSNA